ncbi:MAG: hypothetical protein OXR66_02920 [Candidatus Woesearchaeota archaeon]|nr:hypothetical protein [Candidatus Woesearchaeota archaeon]
MLLEHKIITAFTLINIGLLIGIITLNIKSYIRVRASYTMFILVFAGIFLIQNLINGYFFLTNMELCVSKIGWHMIILAGLQSVAFASLMWMELQ